MAEERKEEHAEELKKVCVLLESEQVEVLKELAEEYTRIFGQRWSLSAVVRVAVGDFLSRLGKFS